MATKNKAKIEILKRKANYKTANGNKFPKSLYEGLIDKKPKRTIRKVTPSKPPMFVMVTACVQITDNQPQTLRKVREAFLGVLSTKKAQRSLRVNYDSRMGKGGIHVDQPFQQR